MANKPKQAPGKQDNGIPQMPFNKALKRVWQSKPQHKTAKKPAEKK
jgi:hypothetical protein